MTMCDELQGDAQMKVFISSLITGMGPIREAAQEAVTTLRHIPVMAENFGAQARSPQVACLTGLRQSDLVLLILGESYGAEQPSGLSATHEEYLDAKGRKPVIAFVQHGVTPDQRQDAFIREVQGWESGLLRGGFKTAEELQIEIVRALHDYELANAVGPLDEGTLRSRSAQLLNADTRRSGSATLNVAIVGGPSQQILRPCEIEDRALGDFIHQAALFGPTRVFDQAKGVERAIEGGALILGQDRDGQRIQLDEKGELLIRASIDVPTRGRPGGFGLPVLIEEDIQRALGAAIALAESVLNNIDATRRLTHLAISVTISGGEHLAWRTQAEHSESPNSVSMGMGEKDRIPVQVFKPRAALRLDVARLVEDLLVPLRRRWKGRER
jgi:hypothetical protein